MTARPPRRWERLLRAVLPSDSAARAILGDLNEDFAALAASRNERAARQWYRREVLRLSAGYGLAAVSRAARTTPARLSRLTRLATRRLVREPMFAATAILIVGLGLATSSAALAVSQRVASGVLAVPSADRLVVPSLHRDGQGLPVGYLDWQDWRDHVPAFDRLALTATTTANLSAGDGLIRLPVQVGTADSLPLLGATAAVGRLLNEADDDGDGLVALLGHGLWLQQFGGRRDAVGSTMRLDGVPVVVVGVLSEGFNPFGGAAPPALFLPMSAWPRFNPQGPTAMYTRGARQFSALGRLAPGVTLDDARRSLEALAGSLEIEYPESNRGVGFDLTTLHEALTGPLDQPVTVLQLASTLLLLVGTLNVVALMLVRLAARGHEQAIELSLGAHRAEVLLAAAAEGVLIALAGAVLGAVGHVWLTSVAAQSSLLPLPALMPFGPDPVSVAITSAAVALALAVSGAVGARMVAPPSRLASALTGTRGSVGTRRTARVRRGLIVTEVALTTCLLVAALVLGRSFGALQRADTGYQTENRLVALAELPAASYSTPDLMRQFQRDVLPQLEAVGGVESAALWSRRLPGQGTSFTTIVRRDRPVASQADSLIGRHHFVTEGGLEDIGLRLVRGRWLSERSEAAEVVISESLAATLWPDRDALGQSMRRFIAPGTAADAATPWYEVVGVVTDAMFSGRLTPDGSLGDTPFDVYYAWESAPQRQLVFLLSARQPDAVTMSAVRAAVARVDPEVAVFDFQALGDALASEAELPRLQAAVMGAYGSVVLGLSAVGLFGLLLAGVRQRSKELSLRRVLGCTRGGIVRLVVGQGARICGLGTLAGLALAWPLTGLLSGQLFGVSPRDPASFLTAAVIVMAVGLVASYLPARAGSRQSPASLLRG